MKKLLIGGTLLVGGILLSSCAGTHRFADSLRRTDRPTAENYRYPQAPDPQGTSGVWARPVTTDSSARPSGYPHSTEPVRDDSPWGTGYRSSPNFRYYRENQIATNPPSAWAQEQSRLEELGESLAQAIDEVEDQMAQVEARMMVGSRRTRLNAEADLVALAEVREALFRTYLRVSRRGHKDLPTLEHRVQDLLRDTRELNEALRASPKR